MTGVLADIIEVAREQVRARHGKGPVEPGEIQREAERAMEELERAVVTADGPGSAVTRRPAAAHAATILCPGSLTEGMPASVTNSTVLPARIASRSAGVRAASTWS